MERQVKWTRLQCRLNTGNQSKYTGHTLWGTHDGVYRTTNGGENWSLVCNGKAIYGFTCQSFSVESFCSCLACSSQNDKPNYL